MSEDCFPFLILDQVFYSLSIENVERDLGTFMIRTIAGTILGGVTSFSLGFIIGQLTGNSPENRTAAGVFFGLLLGFQGCMTGAIIGGIADLMAFLKAEASKRERAAAQEPKPDPRRSSTLPLD